MFGEILGSEMEFDNSHDKYAMAVKNQDGNLVGHVPKELSRLFHKFLDDFGELEAECIGNRLNAGKVKGVEVPVDYPETPLPHGAVRGDDGRANPHPLDRRSAAPASAGNARRRA